MKYRVVFNFVFACLLFLGVQSVSALEKKSAQSVERTMDEDGIPNQFALTLYGADSDGDQVRWSIPDQPKHGVASLSLAGTAIKVDYQPEKDWNGTDYFYVQVDDGAGGLNKIRVAVHVLPRNDPPVNKKPPIISGVAKIGESLTAEQGYWDDSIDGESSDFSYHYQWMRASSNLPEKLMPIQGATSRQYFITESDKNGYLAVRVTATDKKGQDHLSSSAISRLSRVGNQAPMISLKAPEPTFILKSFLFEGNKTHQANELNEALKDYLGKEVSLSDLNEAANTVMKFYQNHSRVIVNAQIPAQEIADNTVRMVIIEGQLGHISVAGNKNYSKDFLQKQLVNAIKENEPNPSAPLRIDTLERALLALNQNAGLQARSVLQRGRQRGEVDIHLNVDDQKSYGVNVGYNNDGSGSISRDRYVLGLDFFNVRNVGGHLNIQLLSGNNPRTLGYGTLSYEEPIGLNGSRVGFTASTGSYEVNKRFFDLGIKGDSNTFSGFIRHPFMLSRSVTVTGEVGFDAKDARFFLLGALNSRDRIRTIYVSTDASFEALGGHTSMAVRFTQGLGELFGGILNTANSSRQGADNLFTRIQASVSHSQPISDHWSVFGSASGQFSDDSLVSSEEWQIGGVNSVRGHLAGSQTGDIGYRASVEFRYASHGELPWVAYTFIDYGYVLRRVPFVAQPKDNYLSGAGVGLIVQKDFQQLTANLTVNLGVPVHVSTSSQKDSNPVFNISMSLSY